MRYNDQQRLRELCNLPETITKAKRIFHAIQPKTTRGSGHDVLLFETGLIAICAYIASDELQNGDLSRESAQKASCIRPADFRRGLEFTQQAWEECTKKDAEIAAAVSYTSLIHSYNLEPAATLQKWMQDVEEEVLGHTVGEGVDPDSADLKHAIFAWTCGILQLSSEDGSVFNSIKAKCHSPTFRQLLIGINEDATHFPAVATSLQEKHAEVASTETRTSLKRSPSKPSLSVASPSRCAPAKRNLEPSVHSDEDTAISESPTKKTRQNLSKVDTLNALRNAGRHLRHSPRTLKAIPNPILIPKASTSRSTVDHVTTAKPQLAESEPEPTPSRVASSLPGRHPPTQPRRSQRISQLESPAPDAPAPETFIPIKFTKLRLDFSDEEEDTSRQRTRFRPVFLDHQQWNARDPRVDAMWKRAREQSQLAE